jgi:hypothetical protein
MVQVRIMEIAMSTEATLSSKGQPTISKPIRDGHGIKAISYVSVNPVRAYCNRHTARDLPYLSGPRISDEKQTGMGIRGYIS